MTVARPQRATCGACPLLAAVVVGACGTLAQDELQEPSADPSSAQAEDPNTTTDPTPVVFVPCPGAEEPGPTGLVGADLMREGTVGTIDVTAVFCNPLVPEPSAELLFYVTLADHFGLAASDVTHGTSLSTGNGLYADGPFTWDGDDLTAADHHAKGHLYGPDAAADGTPLLGPNTSYLELTIGGIGGSGSVVVRWEQEYLP